MLTKKPKEKWYCHFYRSNSSKSEYLRFVVYKHGESKSSASECNWMHSQFFLTNHNNWIIATKLNKNLFESKFKKKEEKNTLWRKAFVYVSAALKLKQEGKKNDYYTRIWIVLWFSLYRLTTLQLFLKSNKNGVYEFVYVYISAVCQSRSVELLFVKLKCNDFIFLSFFRLFRLFELIRMVFIEFSTVNFIFLHTSINYLALTNC